MLAIPLWLLFEVSLILMLFGERKREREKAEEAAAAAKALEAPKDS